MARKKAANGSGLQPRRRADGTYEGRITIDGKTKSFYGKTAAEVRKKMTAAQSQVDAGVYREPSKMTVEQWLDVWQDEYLGRVKLSTRITYHQNIVNYIVPALGHVKLSALNPAQYQRFINDLSRKNGLSPKYIKNIHGVAHAAFRKARKLRFITENPADDAELPDIGKPKIEALDIPEAKALLNVLDDGLYATIVKIDLFTGMREGEILGLQWSCVDFDKGTITIDKQLCRPRVKGASYRLDTPKNSKTRVITPAPFVMELLKQQRQRQIEQRLRAGSVWDDHGFPGLCFTYENGKFLCYQVVLRFLRKALKEAGLSERRFHDLRHSFTTLSREAGDDWKTISENLGHYSVAFTLDTYAHLLPSVRRESSQRMEAFITALSQ